MSALHRGTAAPSAELEQAVLESIVYSDVFDYPLTEAEVRRGLPVMATPAEVQLALGSPALAGIVSFQSPYYLLAGRNEIVGVRRRRRKASLALLKPARAYGALIARLPFVRMVAVTGALAVENSEAGDDIDYLILTAPGRVWLTRTLVMAVVRLAALRGLVLCPNYLLDERCLSLDQHDAYTARELVQMTPVAGGEVHQRMLAANAWFRRFLPNATPPSAIDAPAAGRFRPSRLFETLLGGRAGDALEGWLRRRKAAELQRQAGDNPEAVFDARVCKGHLNGYRGRTEAAVSRRLKALSEARS